ncbi:Flp pilus assembly protein TadD, contains TPR repeats [Ectothiorhodosinus mongolicus]|uniref:Flp pilus assembly protein TadD, contains TPR repeats n=1 Tax=Ectothiorhodosinus mongolicus TaxID=233100 RepID=A0A1R3VM32_9GAMM|nr:tetratricopeptide repeat protein [Ectothiorhodosinus mongolicus]SIT65639.1 Flp pilus assembly protein TadD, contains TPR repeats [Ectothiorhodosinus mongolicus]
MLPAIEHTCVSVPKRPGAAVGRAFTAMPRNGRRSLRLLGFLLCIVLVGACSSNPQRPGEPALSSTELSEFLTLAREAQVEGDSARALFYYQEILTQRPRHAEALSESGLLLLQMGDLMQARPLLQQAQAQRPNDARLREALAVTDFRLGEHEQTRIVFEQLIANREAGWQSHNALGVMADLEGDYQAARGHYQQALALRPNNPVVLNNLGYSRLMARDFSAAERHFREGLRQSPNHSRMRINWGLTLAWQGRYADAMNAMQPPLDASAAANNVGYIALLKNERGIAMRYFEQAAAQSPRFYPRAEQNRLRALNISGGDGS